MTVGTVVGIGDDIVRGLLRSTDVDPAHGTNSVQPEWIDARPSGWAAVSGYLSTPLTLNTTPPTDIAASTEALGDGFFGLLDPDLALRCAYWLPGPGFEQVRAALDDKGGIAVTGAVDEITLEVGTPREITIHGKQKDGFIAYFAPPAP